MTETHVDAVAALHDKILGALDALPKDADEIAAKFEAEGIKGFRGCSGGNCPIEVYLLREIDGLSSIGVGARWIWSYVSNGALGTNVQVDTPAHVRAFVDGFDGGAFPALVVSFNEEINA